MKKRKASFVSILVLICMSLIVCYNFLKEIDSKKINDETISQQNTPENDAPAENNIIDTSGNITTISDISYLVESAIISKTIKEMPKPVSYSDTVRIDENGVILNEFSYLILELTLENKKDNDEILSLINNTLILKASDKVIDMQEAVSLDINEDKLNRKDYFFYNILAKEKKTIKLAYIISDKNIESNEIIFNIDPFGLSTEAERGKPVGKKIGRISLNDILQKEK